MALNITNVKFGNDLWAINVYKDYLSKLPTIELISDSGYRVELQVGQSADDIPVSFIGVFKKGSLTYPKLSVQVRIGEYEFVFEEVL